MSGTVGLSPQLLASDDEAISVGYAEGRELRAAALRVGISEPDLAEQMELKERSWPDERGRRCSYNEAWRRGFEAGFLGRPSVGST
jgi:hypothetical protein